MTDRLYYTEPYLRAFDAVVRGVDRRDDRLVLTLDRTAFYPTSGGQPFDTGSLGGLRVVDVSDEEDGSIAHHLGVSLPGWMGVWLAVFPNVQGLGAQVLAAALVIGSYAVARKVRAGAHAGP